MGDERLQAIYYETKARQLAAHDEFNAGVKKIYRKYRSAHRKHRAEYDVHRKPIRDRYAAGMKAIVTERNEHLARIREERAVVVELMKAFAVRRKAVMSAAKRENEALKAIYEGELDPHWNAYVEKVDALDAEHEEDKRPLRRKRDEELKATDNEWREHTKDERR